MKLDRKTVDTDLKYLIAQGKRKGFLTYEEVNRLLPEDVTSGEKVDSIFAMLEEMGIEERPNDFHVLRQALRSYDCLLATGVQRTYKSATGGRSGPFIIV